MDKLDGKNTGRDSFQSRWGFILACIGSAVGMGNIWLFPYRVGQFGGSAFLIPYFIFVALLGFTGVVEEISFGRGMRTGPLGAFKKATERRGSKIGELIGVIPVIGSLGIAIGYSIVVGWILKFTFSAASGHLTSSAHSEEFFTSIVGNFGSLPWHILAIALALVIMVAGVAKGIEKINKVMMPTFFFMFLLLAIRVAFLPGAGDGYKFLFHPNWDMLKDPRTWIFALGQAFFSLSLAGSGTVVYGSYLSNDEDVLSSARNVAIFDTIAAMLAALVIIPSVFAFGMKPAAGPPLLFLTMPEVFKSMPLGAVFAAIFFIAVLFAGITSLVNLFETPIEALQNRLGFSRFVAVATVLGLSLGVGVFVENADVLSKWMDFVSIYAIPLGALLAAIMFFWVCGDKFAHDEIQKGRTKPLPDFIIPLGKYVFCGLTLLVYILGIVLNGVG